MATLTLDIQSNAPSVLSRVDSSITKTSAKMEKLKKEFSSLNLNKEIKITVPKSASIDSLSLSIKGMAQDMIKLAASVYTYFTSVNSQFEQMNIMLETATGSAKAGRKAFEDIIALAGKTPFSIDAITDSFVKLQSAGFKDTINVVKTLTDSIAAFGGNSDKLKLVSVAMMQMAGTGVIKMEELKRQFGEQVPTAIRIMEKELKRTGKLAKDISIFEAIPKKMVGSLTGTTALIKGLADVYDGIGVKRMKSYQGAVQLLENQFKLLVRDVGQAKGSFGAISEAVFKAAEQIELFRKSARGAEVIAKIAEAIAAGFKKIVDNPEIVYEFFSEIGRLAAVAAEGMGVLLKVTNNLLSTYDMFSGKVSVPVMASLPDGFDMKKYSAISENAKELTALRKKLADDWFNNSVNNLTPDIASREVLSQDEVEKTKVRIKELAAAVAAGVPLTKELAKAHEEVTESLTGEQKAALDIVDAMGKGTNSGKEQRTALRALSQEVQNYANNADAAIKAGKRWLAINEKSVESMKDLTDKYATVGMSNGRKDVNESQEALLEGMKIIENYGKTLATANAEYNRAAAGFATVTKEYSMLQDKISKVGGVSSFEQENRLDSLRDKQEELTEVMRQQLEVIEKMDDIKRKGLLTDKGLEEKIRMEKVDEYYRDAYSSIGAATDDIYQYFKVRYKEDAEAFEFFTGNKVAAAKMLFENMRQLNESATLGWADSIARGLDRVVIDSRKSSMLISDAFEDAFKSMTDSLVEFITTGQMGFDSLSKSLGKSLANVAVTNTITSPLASGLSNLSSGAVNFGSVGKAVSSGWDWLTGSASSGVETSALSAGVADGYYGATAYEAVGDFMTGANELNSAMSNAGEGFANISSSTQTATSSLGSFSAGLLTFAGALLSGQDFTTAAATGVGAGAGFYAGSTLGTMILPGIGTAIGGAFGSMMGAIGLGSLFGEDDENEFGIADSVVKESSGGGFSATKGFTPIANTYDPNFNETAQWYHPIISAYSSVIAGVQTELNNQIFELANSLPETVKTQMLADLEKADFNKVLSEASVGKWKVSEAEDALTGVAEKYVTGTVKLIGKSYGDALANFIESEGASGLIGDSDVWNILTERTQSAISEAFVGAANQIKGGDIEGGLSVISAVTSSIDQIKSSMDSLQEIIDTDGLTEYQLAWKEVNDQFQTFSDSLEKAGIDLDKATILSEAWAISLRKLTEEQQKAAKVGLDSALDNVVSIISSISGQVQAFADAASASSKAVDDARMGISTALWAAQDEQASAQERVNELIRQSAEEMRRFSGTINDFLYSISPTSGNGASLNSLKSQFMVTASAAAAGDDTAQGSLLDQAKSVLDSGRAGSRSAIEYARTEAFVRSQLLMVKDAIAPAAEADAQITIDPMEEAQAALEKASLKVAEYMALAAEVGAETDKSTQSAADSVISLTEVYNKAVEANTKAQDDYAKALLLTMDLVLPTSDAMATLLTSLNQLEDANKEFIESLGLSVSLSADAASALALAFGLSGNAAKNLADLLVNPGEAAKALAVLLGAPGTSATELAGKLGLSGAELDKFIGKISGTSVDTSILVGQFGLTSDAANLLMLALNNPITSLNTLDSLFGDTGDETTKLAGILGISAGEADAFRTKLAGANLAALGLTGKFGITEGSVITLGEAFDGIDVDGLNNKFSDSENAAKDLATALSKPDPSKLTAAENAAFLLAAQFGDTEMAMANFVTAINNLDFSAPNISNEEVGRASEINQAYNTVFGRNAEASGMEYWMGTGLTGSSLIESMKQGASISDSIAYAYRTIFGRNPEAAGLTYWMNQDAINNWDNDTLFKAIANGANNAADLASRKKVLGYAIGSNYLLKDGPIYAHAGEEITPKPFVDMQRSERNHTNVLLRELISSNKELRMEVADLRKSNNNTAAQTKRTADTLVRVTRDGEALVTVTA